MEGAQTSCSSMPARRASRRGPCPRSGRELTQGPGLSGGRRPRKLSDRPLRQSDAACLSGAPSPRQKVRRQRLSVQSLGRQQHSPECLLSLHQRFEESSERDERGGDEVAGPCRLSVRSRRQGAALRTGSPGPFTALFFSWEICSMPSAIVTNPRDCRGG
jgi:hypothetical protein